MIRRRTISKVVWPVVWIWMLGTFAVRPVYGQTDTRYDLDVRGVALSEGLVRAARVAHIDVAFAPELVTGKTSTCRISRATRETLLACVLAGHNLEAVQLAGGAYLVRMVRKETVTARVAPVARIVHPTGVIQGVILDDSTREAIVGAHVLVLGTFLGDATNENGEFVISRVPEGRYTIEASSLGFQSRRYQPVQVSEKDTAYVALGLREAPILLGEVKVFSRYDNLTRDIAYHIPTGIQSVRIAGVDLGFLVSANADRVVGFQLSGFGNLAGEGVNGVQLSSGVNASGGPARGAQIGAIGNQGSRYMNGVQLAGLFNGVRESARGVQAAGLSNMTWGHVKGAQSAGLINITGMKVTGVQAGGIFNLSGDVAGAQLSGVSNHVRGHLTGIQAAGISNLAYHSSGGLQAAGIVNLARNMGGIQAAGVLNVTSGYVRGIQAASVTNVVGGNTRGLQVSSVTNVAGGRVDGIQVSGVVNAAGGRVRGVQLGLVNLADTLEGAQIGLFNFARKGKGLHLGLFNYVREVGLSYDVTIDEGGLVTTAVRSGNRSIPTYLGVATSPINDRYQLASVFGIGMEWGWSRRLYSGIDVVNYSFFSTEYSGLNRFRLHLGYRLSDHLAVFGGPTCNLFISEENDGKALSLWTLLDSRVDQTWYRMWIGGIAGIRISP